MMQHNRTTKIAASCVRQFVCLEASEEGVDFLNARVLLSISTLTAILSTLVTPVNALGQLTDIERDSTPEEAAEELAAAEESAKWAKDAATIELTKMISIAKTAQSKAEKAAQAIREVEEAAIELGRALRQVEFIEEHLAGAEARIARALEVLKLRDIRI